MKDYYRILGVSKHATEKEVKAAYRKLAKLYHPDVVRDDEDKTRRMYEIQEAYACLGDEKSRKEYDETSATSHGSRPQGRQSKEENSRGQNNGQPSSDMSQFERFFGFQPGKGMDTYQDKKNGAKRPDGPIRPEEMFAAFFGGQNHGRDRH